MGLLLALAAAIFCGVSNIYFRKGSEEIALNRGLVITAVVNNVVSFIVVSVYLATFKPIAWNCMGVMLYIISGVLTSFIGRVLFFGAIARIGPSRSGSLKSIAPGVTAVFAIFFLNERISILSILGIVIIMVGIAVVSNETTKQTQHLGVVRTENSTCTSDISDIIDRKKERGRSFGILLGILSGLSFGIGNVFRKLGMLILPFPIIGVALGLITGLLCILSTEVALGRSHEIIASLRQVRRSAYLWAGILNSFGIYFLFFAYSNAPVSVAYSIASAEPLFTILASYCLLKHKEPLSAKFVCGAAMVVVGVTILFLA